MNIVSTLALILLIMVGFSSGRVLSHYNRNLIPGIFDFILVLILWMSGLWTRQQLGKWWVTFIWLFISFITGVLLSALLRDGQATVSPTTKGKISLTRLWESWKVFAHRMGNFQSRMMLAWFYFVIVSPFGLIIKLTTDPLHLRKPSDNSFWQILPNSQNELDDARKQY